MNTTATATRLRASRSSARDMRSGRETMTDQDPDGRDPVTPADFLAGGPRSGDETHRLLGDAMTGLEQPRRDLRLDIEAISGEPEAARDRRPHDLVAGLHVRNR